MPEILDSGSRRAFSSGAVRDVQEGKGRCDLLPLSVVSRLLGGLAGEYDEVLTHVDLYVSAGDPIELLRAIVAFCDYNCLDRSTAMLKV